MRAPTPLVVWPIKGLRTSFTGRDTLETMPALLCKGLFLAFYGPNYIFNFPDLPSIELT